MSRLPSGPISGQRPAGESDIYTVLALIGTISILVATIYVGYMAQTLYGTLIPPGGS
ncbi:MAG: hypothetical protein LC135_05770 [Phycisphaerae bacterium]|nr:hypothetical protein [Phycisphaerae bacterium]MCZ2399363.1 hypothetical protein [Phycisphaerae bacterium]